MRMLNDLSHFIHYLQTHNRKAAALAKKKAAAAAKKEKAAAKKAAAKAKYVLHLIVAN